jgi:hypothetical protein
MILSEAQHAMKSHPHQFVPPPGQLPASILFANPHLAALQQNQQLSLLGNTEEQLKDHGLISNVFNGGLGIGVPPPAKRKKYENDDIPQEMVAKIYQEELAKLMGKSMVDERFGQNQHHDAYQRTQEEIRYF